MNLAADLESQVSQQSSGSPAVSHSSLQERRSYYDNANHVVFIINDLCCISSYHARPSTLAQQGISLVDPSHAQHMNAGTEVQGAHPPL